MLTYHSLQPEAKDALLVRSLKRNLYIEWETAPVPETFSGDTARFIWFAGLDVKQEQLMKADKLNIRPIFHVNEAQTRGHVFVCMFSYAIVKELETAIYPWVKTYNKENNCKLSYHDIIDELHNIKVSEL